MQQHRFAFFGWDSKRTGRVLLAGGGEGTHYLVALRGHAACRRGVLGAEVHFRESRQRAHPEQPARISTLLTGRQLEYQTLLLFTADVTFLPCSFCSFVTPDPPSYPTTTE